MAFPTNRPYSPSFSPARPKPRIPRRGGLIALLLFLAAVGAAAVGRSHGSSTVSESRKAIDQSPERRQSHQPHTAAQTRPAPLVASVERIEQPLEPVAATGASGGSPAAALVSVRLLADAAYAPALDELLKGATRSIDVTMFSCVLPADAKATHPVRKILDRLVQVSQAGVRVRVVFDHGIPPNRLKDGDEPPSENAALYLAERAVDVHWDEDARTTHTKSLVVDGRWCLVGSTNWSYSALSKNREQSVLIDNLLLANELTMHFEGLWRVSRQVVRASK